MVSRDTIKPGDVLTYYHDAGIHAELCYARVVRVNRVTVTVETEHHGVHRLGFGFFTRKIGDNEWSPWNREGK